MSDTSNVTPEPAEQQTVLDAAIERATAAEARVAVLESVQQLALWKTDIASSTGVPAQYLRGSTQDELQAHADELKPLFETRGPIVPHRRPDSDRPPAHRRPRRGSHRTPPLQLLSMLTIVDSSTDAVERCCPVHCCHTAFVNTPGDDPLSPRARPATRHRAFLHTGNFPQGPVGV